MKAGRIILSIGMLFLYTSCVTLYKPNAVQSPLLKEKGELNASASLGLSGCGLYNLQGAYALSNHAGIMLNGMYHNRIRKSDDTSVERLNMIFGEIGTGYFNTFGKEKNGLVQCYSGGGYGYTSDRIDAADQTYPEVNTQYFNVFIQPGVAFINKNLEVAFDVRANYVRLFNIHAYLYDQFEFWNTDFQYFSGISLDFMNLEPNITIKLGNEKFKTILNTALTIPTIHPKSYFDINTSSMLIFPLIKFSVGINYTFNYK